MARLLILLLAFSNLCLAQTIDDVVISRKTEMFIRLERAVNSRTAAVGDAFFGQVAVPVTQNDKVVIPAGSYVKGQVESTKKAARIKGTGQMTLRFSVLILPDGTTREFHAMVTSAEGYETRSDSEEGQIKAESAQASDVGKGIIYGAPIGATAGGVAHRSRTGALAGAGGGAAIGAIVGLLFRNEEVDLPRGTTVTVVLDQDVRFVKPAPEKQGKPM